MKKLYFFVILPLVFCGCETMEDSDSGTTQHRYEGQVVGIMLSAPSGLMAASALVKNGTVYMADDIELGPADNFEIYEDDPEYYQGLLNGQFEEGQIYPTSAMVSVGRRWPASGGKVTIPYVIEPSCGCPVEEEPCENVVGNNRWYEIIASFEDWEHHTQDYFEFIREDHPWNPPGGTSWIKVGCNADTCSSSWIGKFPASGSQRIKARACNDVNGIRHEIGHHLGFFHDQSRLDRDDHMVIVEENVESGKMHNFKMYDQNFWARDKNGWDIGPFDEVSTMFYGSCGFSVAGHADCTTNFQEPTIVRPGVGDPPYERSDLFMSDRNNISEINKYALARRYTSSWYVSPRAADNLQVINWDMDIQMSDLSVGKFCKDGVIADEDKDDVVHADNTTGEWTVFCDAGYTWNTEPDVLLTSPPTTPIQITNAYLVGDFNNWLSVENERFSDILANDPNNNGEWILWEDGVANADHPNPGWTSWHTNDDDVNDLGVGKWCDGVEYGADVIREMDGVWQVSCGAQSVWSYLKGSAQQLPDEVKFVDFNRDGWTDIVRNHPNSGVLQVSFATGTFAPNTTITQMGPWLNLVSVVAAIPNDYPIEELYVGTFCRDSWLNNYDGLLMRDGNKWRVSCGDEITNAQLLTWTENMDFGEYGEDPWNFVYSYLSSIDLVIGDFDDHGGDDAMIWLMYLQN